MLQTKESKKKFYRKEYGRIVFYIMYKLYCVCTQMHVWTWKGESERESNETKTKTQNRIIEIYIKGSTYVLESTQSVVDIASKPIY